jgi:hypothetical protein
MVFLLLISTVVFGPGASGQSNQPMKFKVRFTQPPSADKHPRSEVELYFADENLDSAILSSGSSHLLLAQDLVQNGPGILEVSISQPNPQKARQRIVIRFNPSIVDGREPNTDLFVNNKWKWIIEGQLKRKLVRQNSQWFK